MPQGDVNITIKDGALGNVNAPPAKTAVVIACAQTGTVAAPIITASKQTIVSTFGIGPLAERCCFMIDGGATVIAIRCTAATAGALGTIDITGVTGTSVVTSSGTPYDDYEIVFKVTTGGTIGTVGIQFQVSVDFGRTYGPIFALGTAVTYAVPNTGVTLAFAAGSLITGDIVKQTTTMPTYDAAGISACLVALQASGYQWGAGIWIVGHASGSLATSIDGYLDTLRTQRDFTFAVLEAVDVAASGQTEAQWATALIADYAAVSSVRVVVAAGCATVQSPISNAAWGAPRYRRNAAWGISRRAVQAKISTLWSRVKDGGLPGGVAFGVGDGRVWHDERLTPSLDGSRFMTLCTYQRKQGVFVTNPNIMAPTGSDFTLVPYRQVVDVMCLVTYDAMLNYVNDNVILDPITGLILEKEARGVEDTVKAALKNTLLASGNVSAVYATCSRTDNINTTKKLTVTASILALGYILSVDMTVGLANPAISTNGV